MISQIPRPSGVGHCLSWNCAVHQKTCCFPACLFAGSARAGHRATAIRSLPATAELNGLDPTCWRADPLERLPTCRNSEIDSRLPFGSSTQH
ncbi:transposase domain-containing protein [Massilia violaceinigra]|uniref:Transposase domain-containing protein n=1 Tax=Massilia violaceinigra TaxID=2045208 RepID=A0ABY4A315_9BURK|nr:transposase domain-containing protein [Massilia violaceinigra]